MSIYHHLKKLQAVAQLQVLQQIGPSMWNGSNAGSIFIILPDRDAPQLCEWVGRNCVPHCARVWAKLNHGVRLLIKGY